MIYSRNPENYNGDSKRCSKCGTWKSITEFKIIRKSETGLQSPHCHACEASAQSALRRRNDPGIGTRKTGRKPMEIEDNKRRCVDCGESKALSEFQPVVPSKTKAGCMSVHPRCRPCHLENRRLYRLANQEKAKLVDRKQALKRYGLTIEEYDAMLERQEGLCAICGEPERALSHDRSKVKLLAVDHCHDEDRIRGLLCQDCNTALGLFKDNIGRLFAAADYLAAGGVNSVGVGL